MSAPDRPPRVCRVCGFTDPARPAVDDRDRASYQPTWSWPEPDLCVDCDRDQLADVVRIVETPPGWRAIDETSTLPALRGPLAGGRRAGSFIVRDDDGEA